VKTKFRGGHKTFIFPNEKRLSFIISFYEQSQSESFAGTLTIARHGWRCFRFNSTLLKMKLFLIDFLLRSFCVERERNNFYCVVCGFCVRC
jgi:hypothetical protein